MLLPFIIIWCLIPFWIVGQYQMMKWHLDNDTEHSITNSDQDVN